MKLIGEGAESKVFEVSIFGKPALVKFRQEKKYREKALDIELRTSRTKKEARIMNRATKSGVSVPKVLALGKYSIYMEKISGKLLKDTKLEAARYAEIGSMLAKLHSSGIVHGDFTPANILVGRDLTLIDFGLAEMDDSIEEKAIDLLLMKRSITKEGYAKVELAYAQNYEKSKEVVRRLSEIEKRGRYQIRTLT